MQAKLIPQAAVSSTSIAGPVVGKNVVGKNKDARRSPRYAIDVRVTVKAQNNRGVTTICHGHGTDVSESGMALFIPSELAVNRRVKLLLTLPNSERRIECMATIRNRDDQRYGVEFEQLTPADRDFLLHTCQALALVQ